jgi:hypothetical protein
MYRSFARSLALCFIFFVFALSPLIEVQAQQQQMNRFVSHSESLLAKANQLMESGQVQKAVGVLTDLNRYLDSVVNHELEDWFFNARKENPSFDFSIGTSLARGFDSAYWKRKYDLANSSLNSAKSAVSGLSSHRVLDRQDQAWSYLKTTYDAVKAVKDVVENVTTQEYYDAIKAAKEGVDGFIENYKAIEEAHLQKQKTELLQVEINGLIRRANRVIRNVEPVLSFMKANSEEGERYEKLLARIQVVRQKVLSNAVREMVFGDPRYTFNYGPFLDEIKEYCKEFKELEIEPAKLRADCQTVQSRAKESWKQVKNNIRESNDEKQKNTYLDWADSEWKDFDKLSQQLVEQAIAQVAGKSDPEKKETGKPDLFAGMKDVSNDAKAARPDKPNLFAGLGDSSKEGDSELPDEDEKTDDSAKPNLFAGAGKIDGADKTSVAQTERKQHSNSDNHASGGIKLGSILSNGEGDNKSQGGGTYFSVDLKKAEDDDLVEVRVTSGNFRFVHAHLRNSRGIWYSVYNGTNRIFRVKDLLHGKRSAFTHINFSVNGQHVRYLPVACTADIYLHKSGAVSAAIEKEFANQWARGSGETPNEYMNSHAYLWLDGKVPAGSVGTARKSDSLADSKTTKPIKNASAKNTNQAKTPAKGQKNTAAKTDKGYGSDVLNEADGELRKLVSQMNAVIKRADAEFNKKYWQEKSAPRTTQKATNPKASTLAIMREAIKIARSASYPKNRVTLNYMAARKLIEYSGRVFVFVGKREFFVEAAAALKDAESYLNKVKKDKVSLSFMHYDQGAMWRTLGSKALVGGHSYNKNDCYKLEVACYERALSIYPENFKAKRALGR